MTRKYIKFLATDLIQELEKIKTNKRDLEALINEIGYRKKGAKKLHSTLQKAINYKNEIENQKKKDDILVKKNPVIRKDIKEIKKDTKEKDNSKIKQEKIKIVDKNKESAANILSKNGNEVRPVTTKDSDKSDKKNYLLNKDNYENHTFYDVENSRTFETNFIFKLLGSNDLFIRYKSDYFSIDYKELNFSFKTSSIKEIKIEEGFFLNNIIIFYSDRSCRIRKISKYQTKILCFKINILFLRKKLLLAISEYESLSKIDEYINQRKIENWKKEYIEVFNILNKSYSLSTFFDDAENLFYDIFKNIEFRCNEINDKFITKEKRVHELFFDELESNPLTEAQREAVINDNDAELVVAGAGTGKTSTVIGKIAYLIDKKGFRPDEILGLAFASDAAQEIRDRVKDKIGVDVEIRTFHALGKQIVESAEGKRLKISDVAKNEKAKLSLIATIIAEISKEPKARELIIKFVSKHRYPAKYLEDFDSNVNYLKYLRKIEPLTLTGVKVKSFEELLIADWMTVNGIEYEYEYPYEIETASRQRNQYRPDFYLKEKKIYLEHFGINKDGSTAPFIDADKYNEGIEWKRNLHSLHNTTLIETYSWERQDGIILDNLKKKLEEKGITCKPDDKKTIENILNIRDVNKKLVSLIGDFLSVYKEGQYTIDELKGYAIKQDYGEKERYECFIELFSIIFNQYENYLENRKEIDFADLIVYAINNISKTLKKVSFKRIVVDEYQDIARGRFRLLREIMKQNDDCRIMCVGDDWQAIYGFTGSDIKLTLNYSDIFGKHSRIDLDRSFRFSQPLLDVSSRFIQKNNNQLKKEIISHPADSDPVIEIYEQTNNISDVLDLVEKQKPTNHKWDVMILGRYKFKEPDNLEEVQKKYKNLNIEFKTIHRSKGLGADVVILVGLEAGKYGFPSYIESDPLMNMVITGEDDFLHAEERRVFYVAMTRAKKKLYLCTSKTMPSEFIDELKQGEYPEVYFKNDAIESRLMSCPNCGGKLNLKYPNRKKGFAWSCQLAPYCDGKAKFCNKCQTLPALNQNSCLDDNCSIN